MLALTRFQIPTCLIKNARASVEVFQVPLECPLAHFLEIAARVRDLHRHLGLLGLRIPHIV